MNIKVNEFTIKQEESSPLHFNLYKDKVIEKKGDNKGKVREVALAYGVSLQGAIKRIVADKASEDDNIYSLKEFLVEYNKIVDKVEKIVKI